MYSFSSWVHWYLNVSIKKIAKNLNKPKNLINLDVNMKDFIDLCVFYQNYRNYH